MFNLGLEGKGGGLGSTTGEGEGKGGGRMGEKGWEGKEMN